MSTTEKSVEDSKMAPSAEPAAAEADSNDSDVELEGMDIDEGDEEDAVDDIPVELSDIATNAVDQQQPIEQEAVLDDRAREEQKELEAARKERLELMAAEQKKLAAKFSSSPSTTKPGQPSDNNNTQNDRMAYLLAQSDVFAHFLAGSVSINQKKNKKKGSSRGRLTEAEEDAQLMKSAQSKRRTVRVNQQPSTIAKEYKMYPYQLEGLNWLIKLHDHGINCVLADEMGLGKTLQTISLLAYLRENRGVKGPHIAIVPKSVVGNWIREFRKFCPVIRPIRMGGTKVEREHVVENHLSPGPDGKYNFDVLVTSYEGILKEKNKLKNIKWEYVIIDEAHRIKNENSSLSKVVRIMETNFRLLITGTPLQNNLHELWALLNFLLPDIFGDAEQFNEWFSLSDETGQENVIRKLHTVLRPFMLRRVKKDVACSLPPKKETKLYVGLTKMQQDWYTKVLRKDAHELNSLGGPDRVRLLNILMQLRKVCNHPYLFDGAEPGPPFSDGPHLWENSGKMMLLHKLLAKLQSKGSRVLIFSQMTRVLDILEDYFRYIKYDYCRIDGNTSGEKRDSQMEDFNSDGSSKFVFLLSTRAGGLGINLATADIVILYDSDWNPQVDLQAMDRAHRIGQKKPVQVFRFVCEGTVEEKIIERADRKLFLDAAVVQQGRLAEQNSSLEKNELMKMVRFGADQILSGKGGAYTDEDIDALIAKGEEKTSVMQAKLQTDAQHNLADFTLLAEDEGGMDTFSFGGQNYRDANKGNAGNFINLPQRERKRNYDVNEYFRDAMNTGGGGSSSGMKAHAADAASKKRRKGPSLHDFQLFDKERLEQIAEVERSLASKKEESIATIKRLRIKAREQVSSTQTPAEMLALADEMEKKLGEFKLTPEDQEEKDELQSEGFPDWSRKDYRAFVASLERHGRYNLPSILKDMASEGKEEQDIKRYYVAFFTNYRRIADWQKIIDRVEKGEKKILRLRQIRENIQEKVERHLEDTFGSYFEDKSKKLPSATELLHYSWPKMKIQYSHGTRGRSYQEEEDAFLIVMMHRHGYGAAERIRMEIRRAWQFRFNWFFKSRNAQEIQKRCDFLVRMVEKENEELRKKESAVDSKPVVEASQKELEGV